MDTLYALILGVLQGLAEYLPISSSGHLEIFRQILGINLSGAESLQFDVMLHVATVLSTVVVLWHEFKPLCISFFTFRHDAHFFYVCKILVSCIPIGILGICFKDFIESFFGNGLTLVGICLCITALLLAFAYFFRRPESNNLQNRKITSSGRDITYLDAFIIGCAQSIAVLPGLSRSGTTIATGLIIGNKREEVARFSFFMVIIPIVGEALLNIKDLLTAEANEIATSTATIGLFPMLTGFLAAFIVGCAACKWMLSLVNKGKFVWFALYCLIVGLLCIIKDYNLF